MGLNVYGTKFPDFRAAVINKDNFEWKTVTEYDNNFRRTKGAR